MQGWCHFMLVINLTIADSPYWICVKNRQVVSVSDGKNTVSLSISLTDFIDLVASFISDICKLTGVKVSVNRLVRIDTGVSSKDIVSKLPQIFCDVYDALIRPSTVDAIVKKTGRTPATVRHVLSFFDAVGIAKKEGKKWYRLAKIEPDIVKLLNLLEQKSVWGDYARKVAKEFFSLK